MADGYLFTMLTWGDRMKFAPSAMPYLNACGTRAATGPQVQEGLKKERLTQTARSQVCADERPDDSSGFFVPGLTPPDLGGQIFSEVS